MISNLAPLLLFASSGDYFLGEASTVPSKPPPNWGGNTTVFTFSSLVNMTDISDAPEHPKWQFEYYYDWSLKASRYDHLAGQHDEVCKGVKGYELGEPCTVLNSADGSLYLIFPDSNDCCLCSKKRFTILPNWLQSNDTGYEGQDTINKDVVDEWLLQGASDNHYYATADATQRPVRYMEHKNGKLKEWDFLTWSPNPIEAGTFDAPASCADMKKCGTFFCAGLS